MSKNQSYEIQYTITLKGISTNGFMKQVSTAMIKSLIAVINSEYAQTEVTLEIKELK